MPGRDYHRERTLVGSGECYVALLKSDGTYEPERYLGDAPGATLTTETQTMEVQSSDGPTARNLLTVVISRSYTISLTLRDISPENLQLFTGGHLEDQAAISAPAMNESYLCVADRWIQLGQSSSVPGGVTALSHDPGDLTITTGDDEAAADGSGTDIKAPTAGKGERVRYELGPTDPTDPARRLLSGRLYIPRGSNLAGKWISVDYTPAAPAAKRVKGGATRSIDGSFRYLESADPPGKAKPVNYYARLCSFRGDGQDDLKSRENEQRLTLAVAVMEPGGGYPQLSIDGEAQ